MQPEVPPTQPVGQTPSPQNPAVTQAFQSVAPHPVGVSVQPVDPRALQALGPQKKGHAGLIATVLLSLALLSSLGFGIWAFMGMTDYKTNSDQKSAVAVEKALTDQKIGLDAQYAEQTKSPYETYSGKSEAASIVMLYPRTWSAYVIEQSNGSSPINGYFHPGFVPNTNGNDTAYALRIEMNNTSYADTIKQYEGNIKLGSVTVSPYTFPKVPTSSLGTILSGKILPGKENVLGTMVIIPIRDKTLRLWTESNSAFFKDFNETVLPNFSFVP